MMCNCVEAANHIVSILLRAYKHTGQLCYRCPMEHVGQNGGPKIGIPGWSRAPNDRT